MRVRPRAFGKDAFCLYLLSVERRLANDRDLSDRGSRGKLLWPSNDLCSRSVHVRQYGIALMVFVEAFPMTLPELAATCLQYTQSLFLNVHIVDRMDESMFGEAPAGIQQPPCQRKLNHHLRFPSGIKSCRKADQSIHWTMHSVLMNDGMRQKVMMANQNKTRWQKECICIDHNRLPVSFLQIEESSYHPVSSDSSVTRYSRSPGQDPKIGRSGSRG